MTAHAPYRALSRLGPLAATLALIPTLAGCPTERDATANDDGESSGSGSSSTSAADDGVASPDPSTTGGPADSGSTAAEADDTGTTTDETTSDDRNDTDSSGGEPSCADEGGLCTLDFPKDWNGPVALISWADGEEPPECAGGYDITTAGMLSNDLSAPDAVCTCECGDASGGSCEGEVSINRNAVVFGTTCIPGFLSPLEHGTIEPGSFLTLLQSGTPPIPGPDQIGLLVGDNQTPPTYSGGSCSPDDAEVVSPASFASHVALCAGTPLSGVCEEDTLCMPTAEAPQDTAVCLWQEGEVSCPAGWGYDERTVVYGGMTDDRACSDCSCGSPSGNCTDGFVSFSGPNYNGFAASPSWCDPLPSGAIVSVAEWNGVEPTNNVGCNASGGNPQGEAVGVDPITVCCYEPESR
ncbi:MAG: hypothetical protein JKY37_26755 [Nannocystaceae bacterium]|nr:hypothetical protein [Nannocystaceae bacterium]